MPSAPAPIHARLTATAAVTGARWSGRRLGEGRGAQGRGGDRSGAGTSHVVCGHLCGTILQ